MLALDRLIILWREDFCYWITDECYCQHSPHEDTCPSPLYSCRAGTQATVTGQNILFTGYYLLPISQIQLSMTLCMFGVFYGVFYKVHTECEGGVDCSRYYASIGVVVYWGAVGGGGGDTEGYWEEWDGGERERRVGRGRERDELTHGGVGSDAKYLHAYIHSYTHKHPIRYCIYVFLILHQV